MNDSFKIGAAYIRVSTDDQLEYSPESQIKAIRDYAKAHGIIIPDEYIFKDDGISGRKADKRPGFQKMISIAKEKPTPFQTILVWKFSRFARNREDSIVYKSMLRKQCGIDVVSIAEPIGNDKTSILIEALLEAMDEYYSINLSEEVKRGMTLKAEKGEPLSVPPYGYGIKDKQFFVIEDEAKIVRYIFESFAAGESIGKITKECNSMGARSHRGNLFEQRTVDYILQNPIYIGKVRWNPERRTSRNFDDPDIIITDGSHERLISDELWNEAQEIIVKKKLLNHKSAKPFGFQNMLQGVMRCSACGTTMIKSGKYLQCSKYARMSCTVSHSMPYEKTVKTVLEQIKSDFELGNITNIKKLEPQTVETEIIKAQLKKEEKKLERAKEAFLAEIDTAEEYKATKAEINKTIKDLKSKLKTKTESPEELTKQLIKQKKKIVEKLFDDKVSLQEKNQIIRSFVEKIIFDKANRELIFFYYL